MFRKAWLAIPALGVGLMLGLLLSRALFPQSAHAQEGVNIDQSNKFPISGHGRAISSVSPPAAEHFNFLMSNAPPLHSFKIVPPGKKFVLTDVMYNAQGNVRQDLVVNIAAAYPTFKKHLILFQVKLSPGESDQVHLCSGYVIPAGNALIAFTNAGLAPDQYVSVSVTGYLADE